MSEPFPQTCRGIGDGMLAEEIRRNTGSPRGDRGSDQPATRESQAGPSGVTERPVLPGNRVIPGREGASVENQRKKRRGRRDW